MIQQEVEQGHFRTDVAPVAMAQFILAVSQGISKRLLQQIEARAQAASGGLLNEADQILLMQMIDEQMVLLRAAFAPNSKKRNT
jgi:hypothetical protein